MMFVKSNSTVKHKHKRTITASECMSCPKLRPINLHENDYERPQPIKIAQLIRQAENVKSIQKESARKLILPERLGLLSSKKGTRTMEKQDGMNKHDQSVHCSKRVRRNLNFNEPPANAPKNNNDNKNKSNNEAISKEMCASMTRKSMLLPPNSIKDRHLQKSSSKVSRQSKIPEIAGKNVRSVKKNQIRTETKSIKPKNTTSNSSSRSNSSENMKITNECKTAKVLNCSRPNDSHANQVELFDTSLTKKKSLVSQCVCNQQVETDHTDQTLVEKNLSQETFVPCETNSKGEIHLKGETSSNCIESLCDDLQNAKLISENRTNLGSASSEIIYISRDEIMRLEHNLKNLLRETEENVSKLKTTLSCVSRLLSMSNEQILETDTSKTKHKNSESEMKSSTMLDKEVQVDIPCTVTEKSQDSMTTPKSHVSETVTINEENVNIEIITQHDESNKENDETVNVKNAPDTDESFLELENQLNITYATFQSDSQLNPQKTPMSMKCKQKRSLREYMALKSTMSFLQTPDAKKLKSFCGKGSSDESVLHKAYISKKVLTELHNLYSDSPET